MMAFRSVQKDKKTCTECHWPQHSPTLYQPQENKQPPPPPLLDREKKNIKERGEETEKRGFKRKRAFHCNRREKAGSLYFFYVETAFRANKKAYTHKRVEVL